MRSTTLPLVPLLLVAACADQPAAPAAAESGTAIHASVGGVAHRVSVGGPDICAGLGARPGCDANLTVIALEMVDGSVNGQWEDVSAGGGSESPLHAVVTCLEITQVTNPLGTFMSAWVGGVVTRPQSLAGHPIILRVRDRGTSANELVDLVSRSIVDPQDEGINPDCHARPPMGFALAPQGQVSIR